MEPWPRLPSPRTGSPSWSSGLVREFDPLEIPPDPEEIRREGYLVGPVLKPALAEGKVIFERG